MNIREKLSSPVLWLGVLGTLKFLAQSMGYEITDAVINNIANGAAGVVMVISIFMDHGKTLPSDTVKSEEVRG